MAWPHQDALLDPCRELDHRGRGGMSERKLGMGTVTAVLRKLNIATKSHTLFGLSSNHGLI